MTMYQPLHCQDCPNRKRPFGTVSAIRGWRFSFLCCYESIKRSQHLHLGATDLESQPKSVSANSIFVLLKPPLEMLLAKFHIVYAVSLTQNSFKTVHVSSADQHKACHCPVTCIHWTDHTFKGPVFGPNPMSSERMRIFEHCHLLSAHLCFDTASHKVFLVFLNKKDHSYESLGVCLFLLHAV